MTFNRLKTLVSGILLSLAVLSGPASAAGMSNYLENQLIDFVIRGQTYTAPTTVYYALSTTPASDAACGTEVSGGSYARVAVTASLANFGGTQSAGSTTASSGTSGTTSNNNAITFPSPTANWGQVTDMCVFDAASGGNLLWYSALAAPKNVNNGDAAPSFTVGSFSWQIDN